MAIQEQYILVKKANGDVGITQNSIEVFSSVNASAVVNTLYLKEGMSGIGVIPTTKLHVQVANTINKQALLIEQLDTTNNLVCAEINNDGTNHGFYIHQDGVLASSKYGLYIYSNAAQVNSYLAYINQDNANSTTSPLLLKNDGSGTSFEIDNYGSSMGLDIEQLGVQSAWRYALNVYSNAVQINSPLVIFIQDNASSTAGVLEIDNDGTGHGIYLHQDGVLANQKQALFISSNAVQVNVSFLEYVLQQNASSASDVVEFDNVGKGNCLTIYQGGVLNATKYGLYVYSNVTQVNSALVLFDQQGASSTAPLVELNNDATGHALYIHQDGNLATGKYALYIDNNGTPVDGAGRCIRLDGCTISSTKSPETDAEVGFIAVNINGTQYAVPYYALS